MNKNKREQAKRHTKCVKMHSKMKSNETKARNEDKWVTDSACDEEKNNISNDDRLETKLI